jgi:4-hydroxybenzoate polyprenyltransferase
MNKVGSNIVLGTLWITAGIGMYVTGNGENEIGAAILVVLGFMFYWAAFKIFKDPKLAKKNKKNVVQQMTDPNYKKNLKNFKKTK